MYSVILDLTVYFLVILERLSYDFEMKRANKTETRNKWN